ncbi:MAG: VOC family protein [Methanobacteriota archaeon]
MIRRINPILLFVRDFDRSLKFYRDMLGLKVQSLEDVHEEYASFRVGGIVFAIHGGHQRSGRGPVALHFEVDDCRGTYRALRKKGVRFTRPPEKMPWGSVTARLRDPDGNELEVTSPTKTRDVR